MDIRTLFLVLVTTINISLAALVFLKSKRSEITLSFIALVIGLSAWAITNALFFIANTREEAFFFAQLSYMSGILITTSFWYFSLVFPTSQQRITPLHKLFIPAATILIWMIIWIPGLILQDVDITPGQQSLMTGPGLPLFGAFFVLTLGWGFINTIRNFLHTRGISKAQLAYILWGAAITAILGTSTNLILPLLGNYQLVWLGPDFATIFIGTIAYTIIRHRLFDIRIIIKKTVIYSGLLAFVIGTYSLIIFTLASLFGTSAGLSGQTFLPNLAAALVVALGFEPIRRWLVATTDKYLFVGEYRPQEVLRELSRSLSDVIDLDEALQGMMQILVKNMRLKAAATFVLRRYKESVEVKRVKAIGFDSAAKLKLEKNDPLIAHFEGRLKGRRDRNERRHYALVTEELARRIEENGRIPPLVGQVHERLVKLGAAVALPLVVNEQLIGILILSDKLSGDIYTSTDLDFLEIVAHETAGAIEKARFWEEDQLKSEFVSIASHELLTPTSTIQGYLSMILDEGMGKVDPKAREYLERVRGTSKRLTELVQDLLNVSRIESGRIKIVPQPMDLPAAIREVVTELAPQANAKGLSLHFEDPVRGTRMNTGTLTMDNKTKLQVSTINSQFTVFADPERLRQVLVNLIGNAVKYTSKGGVIVSVAREARHVAVSVTDTGVGMTPEDRKHLFEKFYRIQNEQTTGISGTGLGLYIAKNIVERMGGKIEVQSSPRKGSTFRFTVPATKAVPQKVESAGPGSIPQLTPREK
jgi:signal transduction histidine kinase